MRWIIRRNLRIGGYSVHKVGNNHFRVLDEGICIGEVIDEKATTDKLKNIISKYETNYHWKQDRHIIKSKNICRI